MARWLGGTALDAEIEALFGRPIDEGVSLALVVQQHGEIVAERYGTQPGEPVRRRARRRSTRRRR